MPPQPEQAESWEKVFEEHAECPQFFISDVPTDWVVDANGVRLIVQHVRETEVEPLRKEVTGLRDVLSRRGKSSLPTAMLIAENASLTAENAQFKDLALKQDDALESLAEQLHKAETENAQLRERVKELENRLSGKPKIKLMNL